MPIRHDRVAYHRLMKRFFIAFSINLAVVVLLAFYAFLAESDRTFQAVLWVLPAFILYGAYYGLRHGELPVGIGSIIYGFQARLFGAFYILVFLGYVALLLTVEIV